MQVESPDGEIIVASKVGGSARHLDFSLENAAPGDVTNLEDVANLDTIEADSDIFGLEDQHDKVIISFFYSFIHAACAVFLLCFFHFCFVNLEFSCRLLF